MLWGYGPVGVQGDKTHQKGSKKDSKEQRILNTLVHFLKGLQVTEVVQLADPRGNSIAPSEAKSGGESYQQGGCK